MNYHKIDHVDLSNGDGIRVVLWVSGCSIRCSRCQNPQTWDRNSGIEFDDVALGEILDALRPDCISGLTITGGHPLEDYNLSYVELICEMVKAVYPNKNIWIYTGYEFEDIRNNLLYERVLNSVDVIVDGKYEDDKRDITLAFRGSTNQRIWRNINGQWTADTK